MSRSTHLFFVAEKYELIANAEQTHMKIGFIFAVPRETMGKSIDTDQHGMRTNRNYRTHDLYAKTRSAHPLDVLSDILFEIRAEKRKRDAREESNERAKHDHEKNKQKKQN